MKCTLRKSVIIGARRDETGKAEPVISNLDTEKTVKILKIPLVLSDGSRVFNIGIYDTLSAKTESDADALIAGLKKLIEKHCV
jgi:hypothetical protein